MVSFKQIFYNPQKENFQIKKIKRGHLWYRMLNGVYNWLSAHGVLPRRNFDMKKSVPKIYPKEVWAAFFKSRD